MRSAVDSHRVRAFRRWAPLFEVFDHEGAPTNVAVMASGFVVLAWLAAAEGRPLREDGSGPTLLALLALTALGATLVMVAGESLAWLMARPVGRDIARAEVSLEHARVAVSRVRAVPAPRDADLAPYVARIERAAERLDRWLAEADARVVAWATLQDPSCRASRFGLLRDEGQAIVTAAEALDGVSRLLGWIAMCPWSPEHATALARLPRDLAAAERLVSDGA